MSVTCHTMSRNVTLYTLYTLPPGSGPTNADWSLFIKAESDSWLCSAPLPVCSGLSVIKRSEDFLAKMFLQRKQAGSKSRGRFWKFNQIWSPLSPLCGGHVSSSSPSLSCLGARLDLSLARAVNELKRLDLRSFGGPMTLLQGREKIWTKLWQISLKNYYKILSVKYEQAFPVSIQE